MEIADVMIKIGNDRSNEQLKKDVTPAEVIVLNAVHGPGSVSNIKIKSYDENGKGASKRSHRTELNRLRERYQADPGSNTNMTGTVVGETLMTYDPSKAAIIDRLFPGMNPNIPLKFSDLNIVDDEDEEEEETKPLDIETEEEEETKNAPKSKRGRPVLREVETASA